MNILSLVDLEKLEAIAVRVAELNKEVERCNEVMANTTDFIDCCAATQSKHKAFAEQQQLQRDILAIMGF